MEGQECTEYWPKAVEVKDRSRSITDSQLLSACHLCTINDLTQSQAQPAYADNRVVHFHMCMLNLNDKRHAFKHFGLLFITPPGYFSLALPLSLSYCNANSVSHLPPPYQDSNHTKPLTETSIS